MKDNTNDSINGIIQKITINNEGDNFNLFVFSDVTIFTNEDNIIIIAKTVGTGAFVNVQIILYKSLIPLHFSTHVPCIPESINLSITTGISGRQNVNNPIMRNSNPFHNDFLKSLNKIMTENSIAKIQNAAI